jgi:PAS domain S-box-containing protein
MKSFVNLLAPADHAARQPALKVLVPAVMLVLGGFAGIYFSTSKPLVIFYDNVHWTVSYAAAAWLAWIGVRAATPDCRPTRRWFAIGLTAYAIGQVAWDIQVYTGWNPFPGPSDFFYLWLGPCSALGLIAALGANTDRSQRRTIALDTIALSVVVLVLTLALYLPRRGDTGIWPLSVMVAYPVGLLAAASIGLILIPTLRMRWEAGWLMFLGALLTNGAIWMQWNSLTLDNALQDGSLYNTSFSVTALVMGWGALSWRVEKSANSNWERYCEGALRLLPLLVVIGASASVVLAWTIPNVPRAVQISSGAVAIVVAALALARQSILLRERDRLLKAEKIAHDSQVNFKTLFESAQDAILIMDERSCVDCNSSALKLFGCEKHQIVGTTPADFSPEFQPDGRRSDEKGREFIMAALQGQPQFFEWTNQKLDRSEFYAEVRLNPVAREGGKFLQVIMHDITERKCAEAALRASEAKYRTLVERMGEGLLMVDNADTIQFANQFFCEMTGYAAAELLGKNASELLLAPAERERMRQRNRDRQQGLSDSYEVQLRCRSGKLIRCRHTATPVFDASGAVSGSMAIIVDITQNQKLEEQLRQSQKMEAIGQLSGGVAHDFNNILAAMIMQTDLANMIENLPEEARESFKELRASAERAANLTRQLLAFSRQQVMQPRVMDLNDSVTNLTKMLQRIVGEDVHIQLNLHPRPAVVRADTVMLDHVLNLVVNARDAMPNGGRLIIETAEKTFDEAEASLNSDLSPGRYFQLRVTDTGHGIAPEILPRIFEPFFTTKEPGQGTGLGLATVFGIIKQHGGAVQVESEPGRGTSFHVFLPARATEELLDAALAVSSPAKASRGTETILVVEDDASVRAVTRVTLKRHGYQVLEASHGVEALRVWEQHGGQINLLLTDIVMPEGINGRELAARLQQYKPDLRVVFTSGYSADIAGRELKLQAGQNFIQKPSLPQEILDIIRRSLDS